MYKRVRQAATFFLSAAIAAGIIIMRVRRKTITFFMILKFKKLIMRFFDKFSEKLLFCDLEVHHFHGHFWVAFADFGEPIGEVIV